MSKGKNDEPPVVGYCEAVSKGLYGNEAELTIFDTPKKGSCSSCRGLRASYKLEQGYRIGSLLRQILSFTTDTWREKKERFQTADCLEPHNSHFKRGYHLCPPVRQGKFLLIVLTVFNEQCLRMYISLTEFVITSSGYWLQLMLTLILKAAAQYDNMNLVINIRAGSKD